MTPHPHHPAPGAELPPELTLPVFDAYEWDVPLVQLAPTICPYCDAPFTAADARPMLDLTLWRCPSCSLEVVQVPPTTPPEA